MTDVLKRTKTLTEAALMIPDSERQDVTIDYDKVNTLNLVANALLNPSTRRFSGIEIISIQWGFVETEENFKSHIGPWLNYLPTYYPDFMIRHVETWRRYKCWCGHEVFRIRLADRVRPDFPGKCPSCGYDLHDGYHIITRDFRVIVKDPTWSFFFAECQCLAPEGYDLLRNSFIAWATPQVQLFLAELSDMVSPGSIAELVTSSAKPEKKGYAEKVKEISEVSKDEGSVD